MNIHAGCIIILEQMERKGWNGDGGDVGDDGDSFGRCNTNLRSFRFVAKI